MSDRPERVERLAVRALNALTRIIDAVTEKVVDRKETQ